MIIFKKMLLVLASPFIMIWQGVNNRERYRKEGIEKVMQYQAYRQELFNCLYDLGCIPTSSELDEVERIVKKG